MNILLVVKGFPPAISGSTNYVYMVAKELLKLGHEVTIATTTSMTNRDIRGFSTGRSFTWKTTCPEMPRFEVVNSIQVYRFKPIFQFWTYMINPSMFAFLLKNVNRYKVVHVHAYMGGEADIVAIACKLRNIPMVLTAHDMVTTQSGFVTILKGIYDKTLGKIPLNTCKKALADTLENVREYRSLGVPGKKIVIIPGAGVDYERFARRQRSESLIEELGNPEKIVLFVGRLLEYKGAQYIIHAIKEITREYPKTKFIFVGEDWGYKDQLVDLAKDLGVIDLCIFTEMVSEEKLLDFYATSDVFVLPSIIEGFGLVTVESIASGLPIILADAKGLKHTLSNIGGYPLRMSRNVPKQIAEHVKRVFSDPDVEEIERRREVVRKHYTYTEVAKQHLKVYEQLIGETAQYPETI